MKMNWGVRVFLLYISFVLLILFLVFRSFQENIDLVTEDYYQQELDFQNIINKKNNANNLEIGLSYILEGKRVSFAFPPEHKEVEGHIKIYRPSNKNFDRDFKIEINEENYFEINLENSPMGLYKMMVDWKNDSVAYYIERDIYLKP